MLIYVLFSFAFHFASIKRLPTMQETWVRFLDWEDPLEKEMAIHSSTLAWKIPWMKEPDRLLAKSRTRLHFHFQGKYGVETGDYLPGKM